MPRDGELTKGKFIGKSPARTYIWRVCIGCGEGKWVKYDVGRAKPTSRLTNQCPKCYKDNQPKRERAYKWKGGRTKDKKGYVSIYINSDSFYYRMAAKDNYVLEHRLVMAMSLNRCLLPWEIVHHKNGIKDDNRIENLELIPSAYIHNTDLHLIKYAHKLEARVIELEDLIKEAKNNLREMKNNSYNKQIPLLVGAKR